MLPPVNSLEELVRAAREAKPCLVCQPPGLSNIVLAHAGSVLSRAARCEDCLASVVRAVVRAGDLARRDVRGLLGLVKDGP